MSLFLFICIRAAIICTAETYIFNGYIANNITNVTVDSRVVYKCDTGFNLDGNENRTCGENGSFLTPEPVCRPVECSNVTQLNNGRTIGSNYTFGDSVTFSCNRGYKLSGEFSITCQANGSWTAGMPTCEGKWHMYTFCKARNIAECKTDLDYRSHKCTDHRGFCKRDSNSLRFKTFAGIRPIAWCSEIGSLMSLDAPELRASVTWDYQFHCTRLYMHVQTWPGL